MKICVTCLQSKSNALFRKHQRCCNKCCSLKTLARRKKNPDQYKNYQLTRLYGITLAEYRDLSIKQNNKCANCNEYETHIQNGKIKPLAVDHNHITGKIRALLCNDCNTALGLLKENLATILSLANYVKIHNNVAA